jgi:hypothetical protein
MHIPQGVTRAGRSQKGEVLGPARINHTTRASGPREDPHGNRLRSFGLRQVKSFAESEKEKRRRGNKSHASL